MKTYSSVYKKKKLNAWLDITTHCNAACPQCHRTDPKTSGKVDWLPLIQWSFEDFKKAFPTLALWYDSIPETNLAPLTKLVDGDDAKSNRYVEGVLKQAKDEGWVLNPQWNNPGSQDYIEPDDQQQDDMVDLIEQLNKNQDTKYAGSQVKKIL